MRSRNRSRSAHTLFDRLPGYGHTGPEVSPGLTISQAQADGWLEADVAKAAAAVPNPKPELRLDLSAISAGQSAVVTSYADVVEPVQRAVVSIYSTKIIKERVQVNPLFRQFFPGLQDQERESKQEGMGSGVIVSADGYILTNNHVVEDADELEVEFSDGSTTAGRIIGTDPQTDLAVLERGLISHTLFDFGTVGRP